MILTDEEIEIIVRDEDFDISTIYVLEKGEFALGSPNTEEIVSRAFEKAMKEAGRKHKEAGVPMVIELDGEIVYIQPEEIGI